MLALTTSTYFETKRTCSFGRQTFIRSMIDRWLEINPEANFTFVCSLYKVCTHASRKNVWFDGLSFTTVG